MSPSPSGIFTNEKITQKGMYNLVAILVLDYWLLFFASVYLSWCKLQGGFHCREITVKYVPLM